MRIRLIADWKQAHKWMSVRLSSAGAVLSGLGFGLSMAGGAANWFGTLPLWIVCLIALVIFTCAALGRILTLERKHASK